MSNENFIAFEITSQLLPCVGCAAPYIIINGVPQGVLEFRRNALAQGVITVTPHHSGCRLLRSVHDG